MAGVILKENLIWKRKALALIICFASSLRSGEIKKEDSQWLSGIFRIFISEDVPAKRKALALIAA